MHSEQTTDTDIQCASERVNFLPLDSHQEGRVRKKKRKVSLLQTLMGNSSLSVLPLPPLPSPLCFCLPELFHAQTMKECLNLQQKKCYLYSYYGLIIYIMGRHWLFKFRENESALTEAFFVLPSSIFFNVHMGSTFFCLRDIERLCAKFTTTAPGWGDYQHSSLHLWLCHQLVLQCINFILPHDSDILYKMDIKITDHVFMLYIIYVQDVKICNL